MKFYNWCGIILVCISLNVEAQEIKLIKFPDLQKIIEDNNSIKIINFWATWCKPCIEEIPYFEALNRQYAEENVDVILISFDFGKDALKKVNYFVSKKRIDSKVLILDETDFNDFIDKVDPSWSGALPATLLVDNSRRKKRFFEKQFKSGELEEIFKNFIN